MHRRTAANERLAAFVFSDFKQAPDDRSESDEKGHGTRQVEIAFGAIDALDADVAFGAITGPRAGPGT